MKAAPDLFAEARDKYTIADLWHLFGFDGEPRPSCRSPFREDKTPSFSIHSGGKAWTDHATGDGGDVIEFIRHAIGGNHKDVREWLAGKSSLSALPPAPRQAKPVQQERKIKWPSELVEGTRETWEAFATNRGYTYPAVHSMVQAGLLRFCKVDGHRCFVVTDATRKSAEIRRIDRQPFGESKVYQLSGVDKSWLPGLELLRDAPKSTAVLMTEGATDFLAGIDIYSRYRRSGGNRSWMLAAILGAKCRAIHPEAVQLLRGRHVRLVPDSDPTGDEMGEHWTGLLRKIGCSVDVVNLPRDTDLSDHLATISPADLFSR